MSKIYLLRQNQELPPKEVAHDVIMSIVDGQTEADKRAWRRLWMGYMDASVGEIFVLEYKFARSSPFHRWAMKVEGALFDSQEQFDDREQFRNWLKVGAGWVDWKPSPLGGVVPIPKSISYAKADEQQFREYVNKMIDFVRSDRATGYLYPHLSGMQALDVIDSVLERFERV